MLLALAALASAHSPHDVCPAVARAADGALLAGETEDLVRYDADGTVSAHVPSPGDVPVCLASLGPGAWALVTAEGAAWRSDDDGARWTALGPSGTAACAEAAGGALIGGADGVWWVPSTAAAGAERLGGADDVAVVAVAEAGGDVYALDGDGALRVLGDDGLAVAHEGPWNALAGGDVLLLADGPGVAVWEAGGARAVPGPPGAVVLAAGLDAWLAAAASGGVWASRDLGATWIEEATGLEEASTGSGSPGDGAHWSALVAAEDAWVAASWEGLYGRGPEDARWTQWELRTSPFVRALQWLADGTLLTAPYGAGLARGTPGADASSETTDWVDAAPSLGWPWLRAVLATEGGAGRWWAVGGVHLYASDDGGASWRVVLTGLALVGDVVAVAPGWPEDARVWSGGVDDDGAGALVASGDAGATWTATRLPGCSEKPSALATDGTTTWVGCGGGVWEVASDGAARMVLPAPLAAGAIVALLPTPEGLVVGGDGGLWRLADEPVALLPTRVRAAVDTDDAWIVSTDRGLVRVTGAGSEPLGWPSDDLIASLAVGGDGRLAAGGFDGAWTSDDAGVTWALATDRDRYDDLDTTWFYDGWAVVEDPAAKRGDASVGEAGAAAEWRLAATALAVYGRGEGRLLVTVDGGDAAGGTSEEVAVAGGTWGVVWGASFEGGIHTVRIEVLDGRVALDGGERWRAAGADPFVHEPPTAGPPTVRPRNERPCGCGGGGGAGALLVGLAMVGRRRR